MKLSGIGKMPYISASTLIADFGNVFTHLSDSREVCATCTLPFECEH
jgi:hypothetical protein